MFNTENQRNSELTKWNIMVFTKVLTLWNEDEVNIEEAIGKWKFFVFISKEFPLF